MPRVQYDANSWQDTEQLGLHGFEMWALFYKGVVNH